MRAVIDTNILVSAFLWKGTPGLLIEQVRDARLEWVISAALIEEFARTIARPKFAVVLGRTTRTPERMVEELRNLAEVVVASPLSHPVCRDPKDDIVLACARAARVNFIVSGDDDLRSLNQFENIPIVTAAQALEMLEPV